jgi:lipopolysaccharide transport system ATP-binding protein
MSAGEVAFVEWGIEIPFALGEFRIDSGIKPEVFSDEFYDRVFCISSFSIVPDVNLLKRNFGGYLFTNANINITIERTVD